MIVIVLDHDSDSDRETDRDSDSERDSASDSTSDRTSASASDNTNASTSDRDIRGCGVGLKSRPAEPACLAGPRRH